MRGLRGAGLVVAVLGVGVSGCSKEPQAAPGPSPSPTPYVSEPTELWPTVVEPVEPEPVGYPSDGSDISACLDGTCEVRAKAGDTLGPIGKSQTVFSIMSIKGGAVNITIDFTKTGGSATVTLKDNEFAPFPEFSISADDVEDDQAVITIGPDEP
jgi:hypothetical protein